MLFLVLALALVYANRTLMVDSRTTEYQVRASSAFEAAEAGIEWMTAQLNDPRRIDDACEATSVSSARNLRDRLLNFDVSTGVRVPRTWLDGSVARPLQVACVGNAAGWQCSCPTTGLPHPTLGAAAMSRPAFLVSMESGSRSGTLLVRATGCNNPGLACIPTAGIPTEGKATVLALLALLPALMSAPAATLTVQGDVVANGTFVGLSNTDAASGGITADVGGAFVAPQARLTGPAGAAATLSVVEGDAALQSMNADRLFARYFGMDKSTWKQRPGVAHLTCSAKCGPQVDAAMATGASLLWFDGDVSTDGAYTWGSTLAPVIMIATGEIHIAGATTINGVLYGHDIVWDDALAGTAGLQGAAISETGYRGTGSPDLVRNASVLHALNVNAGTFVRVPGSWKDF